MVEFDDHKQDKKIAALRKKEEEALLEKLSEKYGIPYLDLAGVPISTEALGVIDEKEARESVVAPFALDKTEKTLQVAIFSPNNDRTTAALGALERKGYKVEPFMTTHENLEKIWERYKDISFSQRTEAGVLDIEKASVPDLVRRIHSIDAAKELIETLIAEKGTHQISKLLELILAGGIALDASDVHLEAEEERVRIRYRLDGVLQDVTYMTPRVYKLLLARVKLLSGLKLNVQADTQDGRFSVKLEELEIEMRVSILPSNYGESVVMRILNPESIAVSLEELGMRPEFLEMIKKEIEKPKGMILTTGPTGSGKTTTLYAFLRTIYNPEVKVITIEDPVEYHLPGISQTQVDKNSNYTFLSGLRAALRQDPDVIMIGEIRDSETAGIAVNSALTGHLVFSTLHTNNAAGAIPRLIDLEVNPKVISSALNATMAQRLVRRLCDTCKKEKAPTEEERELIQNILKKIEEKGHTTPQAEPMLREAQACEKCNNTGYKGRIGIYEAILMDDTVADLIDQNPSERDLKRAAVDQGILDMREDGILKVLEGTTSLDELGRVVDLHEGL